MTDIKNEIRTKGRCQRCPPSWLLQEWQGRLRWLPCETACYEWSRPGLHALFDEGGNHCHFAFHFSLFSFETSKVKGCVQRYRESRNNRILLGYQLIDRRYEHRFDVILRQMRCCAFFVTIEFMITLSNYPAVFAVGMPYL